jgi:sugar phosphate isomerase/epimerase
MFKNLNVQSLGISGSQSEIIELTLSYGFKSLDVDIVEFAQRVEEDGLSKARRLLDSAKLKIASFALPLPLESEDDAFRQDLERLAKLAPLAAELGCTRAVTTVAPATDRRPFHENFEFHRKRLSEVSRVLEPLKIRLGVGFDASPAARQGKSFQFIADLEALLLLLSMVGSRHVGVALDLWQVHLSSGMDKLQKVSPGQVMALEVSDAAANVAHGALTDEHRLLPGETGVIDVPAVLTFLAEKGYDGPVTPKAHPQRFAGLRRDAIAKLAGGQLDQVWKAARLSPAGKLLAPAGK